MKRFFIILCATIMAMGTWTASAQEADTNLLQNGGFEDYSCNFLGCAWEDWTMPLGLGLTEENDKIEGNAALCLGGNIAGMLDQPISLSDESYPVGRVFRMTLNYKALELPADKTIAIDCYWEPKPGGDAETMKMHEADKLQRVIADSPVEGWQTLVVETSKPEKSAYFRVRVHVDKNVKALFDAFSVIETDSIATPEGGGTDTIPGPPQTDEWAQEFVWDNANPRTLLIEGFDNASHNMPWSNDGWQNVAAADQRPWWGFESAKTQILDGDGKFVKATAYQYATPSTGTWESWLITPPLDYRNAAAKTFAFSVMGQYLPDEEDSTRLEIFYIDATDNSNVFRQNLTSSFDIPKTADMTEKWVTFYLDLEPFAQTMADVFYMGFHYIGPNGNEGVVTYYLDDISWGRDDLPPMQGIESIQHLDAGTQKILRDGQVIILRGGREYTILGSER